VTDPEYVARLVEATKISDPKRVEMRFENNISRLIVEARDLSSPSSPQAEQAIIMPDEDKEVKELINWLKAHRIKESISIDELALKIGVSKGSLKAYFAGKRLPGQMGLGRIRKFKEDSELIRASAS
jgi:Helix-turn-helix